MLRLGAIVVQAWDGVSEAKRIAAVPLAGRVAE
jgi:hypothetical protein